MRPLAALVILGACGSGAVTAADGGVVVDAAAVDAAPADARGPDAAGLVFSGSCDPGDRIVIGAVGDVLLHPSLQEQAYERGFATLWDEAAPLIARAGVAYANFEGTSAAGLDRDGNVVPDPGPVFDDVVYTGFPQFNYHGSVIPALLTAGFDVVSTANNHAIDRGALGVEKTLDALTAGGMPATGTKRRSGQGDWYTILSRGGFRLAWLACAFSTNIPDDAGQVLSCDEDEDEVVRTVSELAERDDVDAVIVTPHGGDEYDHTVTARQRRLAGLVTEAGALVVVGNHPHVVQPWEKRITGDGREAFVMYSIGNFVSGQGSVIDRQASVVLYVGLLRVGGKTRVSWVGYVPTYMQVGGSENTLWPADVGPSPGGEMAAEVVGGFLDPGNALPSDGVLPVCR